MTTFSSVFLFSCLFFASKVIAGAQCLHYESTAPGGHFFHFCCCSCWIGQREIERGGEDRKREKDRHLKTCLWLVKPPSLQLGAGGWNRDSCTSPCASHYVHLTQCAITRPPSSILLLSTLLSLLSYLCQDYSERNTDTHSERPRDTHE